MLPPGRRGDNGGDTSGDNVGDEEARGSTPARVQAKLPTHRSGPSPCIGGPAEDAGRAAPSIFVYDSGVREDDVTDEMIEAWAAEAEAGYDVDQLKRRGRGRPGRGAEPMQVVAVRLTADELLALDAMADREQVSRSEAIRRALAAYAA